jgi:exodeoxyribonuclease V gamma subunit
LDRATGIRWGIEACIAKALACPPFERTAGARAPALLLGYALPAMKRRSSRACSGARVEAAWPDPRRFVDFARALFAFCRHLKTPRTLTEWESTLRNALNHLFPRRRRIRRRNPPLRALSNPSAARKRDGLDTPIAFEVLRAHLGEALGSADSGSGFLAGCVTFCALKPCAAYLSRCSASSG